MVLYYGLLALETANNTVAAATNSTTSLSMTTPVPGPTSDRMNFSNKHKNLSSSNVKLPFSSSASSTNSWIYTEDLRKRFEERYADFRYVFVPVYIDRKSNSRSHSTTALPFQKVDYENSWIYSRPLKDHLNYSVSKMSLPIPTNLSSSTCCVTNPCFMRDEIPSRKGSKGKFFRRSLSNKDKSEKSSSSSSLPFNIFNSNSSYTIPSNMLTRHRTSDVVEEEDDEAGDDENGSIPLIKHNSTGASSTPACQTATSAMTEKTSIINLQSKSTAQRIVTSKSSSPSKRTSSLKQPSKQNNKLTRLRSFFFKPSSSSLSSFSSSQAEHQQTSQAD